MSKHLIIKRLNQCSIIQQPNLQKQSTTTDYSTSPSYCSQQSPYISLNPQFTFNSKQMSNALKQSKYTHNKKNNKAIKFFQQFDHNVIIKYQKVEKKERNVARRLELQLEQVRISTCNTQYNHMLNPTRKLSYNQQNKQNVYCTNSQNKVNLQQIKQSYMLKQQQRKAIQKPQQKKQLNPKPSKLQQMPNLNHYPREHINHFQNCYSSINLHQSIQKSIIQEYPTNHHQQYQKVVDDYDSSKYKINRKKETYDKTKRNRTEGVETQREQHRGTSYQYYYNNEQRNRLTSQQHLRKQSNNSLSRLSLFRKQRQNMLCRNPSLLYMPQLVPLNNLSNLSKAGQKKLIPQQSQRYLSRPSYQQTKSQNQRLQLIRRQLKEIQVEKNQERTRLKLGRDRQLESNRNHLEGNRNHLRRVGSIVKF